MDVIDKLLEYPLASVLAYFSVGVLALILFIAVFERITRYNGWEEIRKGNVAAAMATGGKIFGICNIFRFSIIEGDSIYVSMMWAAVGFVLLIVAYFLFEYLTPVFRVDEEIGKGNLAVGLLAMIISVSLSFIIGAALT